ncbi:site-specific DNA-methyltransferase [Bradyrhizobium sp. AUGA SZCCT0169]|uniref:site-specific DNA-methyltransferase n=2 Tax=unclassified Bradyrhizobium TaxID=2631580 RepID=UPI001BABA084|nr:site-specific DNA-methyltransferase [Bradyrhizobium sp. AUGA SZCCT0169]MBR1251621.1 site-specific DNA-methyltransferase [Bradyrhizobium sp. AUGA SZCCT0169]
MKDSGVNSETPGNTRLTKSNLRPIEIQVQYRAVTELILDQNNPRQHSPKQVNQIADSIREFGFLIPIVVDATGNVVTGHGRVLAAKYLGMTEVPLIEVRHLSAAQLKALRIADNKLALNAHWDERLLAENFLALKDIDLDFDLSITGFCLPEIDLVIQDFNSIAMSEADGLQDATTGVAICRVGDLWRIGKHLVFCGDATSEVSFERVMRGERANVIFVDPPYNIKIDGPVSGKGKTRHREFAQASGELSSSEFTDFLQRACTLLERHSVDGAIHYICMGWYGAAELLAAGKRIYSDLKNICVWAKNTAGLGSLYRSQHEFIFVFKAGTAPHVNNVALGKHGRHRSNVWNYDSANTQARRGDDLLALHPTAKPVHLVMDAILHCSNRGDIVLDSFLGSGTALLAAERTGRVCRGIELDPLYVDTAIRRWQNLTGLSAHRVLDNKAFQQLELEAIED